VEGYVTTREFNESPLFLMSTCSYAVLHSHLIAWFGTLKTAGRNRFSVSCTSLFAVLQYITLYYNKA